MMTKWSLTILIPDVTCVFDGPGCYEKMLSRDADYNG